MRGYHFGLNGMTNSPKNVGKYGAGWADKEKVGFITFSKSWLKKQWNASWIIFFFNLKTKYSDKLLGFLCD